MSESDQLTETTHDNVHPTDETEMPTASEQEKKAGMGPLNTLLLLVALGLGGYNLWHSTQTQPITSPDWQPDIEQLQSQQQNIQSQLNANQQEIAALQAQSQQAQPTFEPSLEPQPVIDYQPQIDQLTELLNTQNQLIQSLEDQLNQQQKTAANTASPNRLELPDNGPQDDRQLAAQTLYACRLLLLQGQFEAATNHLQSFLNQANLTATHRQALTALLSTWQNTPETNNDQQKQQLQSISQRVRDLTLPTQEAGETGDAAWYDRFVSIKKIDDSQGPIQDSNALMLIKTEITSHLQQAAWALTLKQTSDWQQHLNAAAQLLPQHEKTLKKEIKVLAKTTVDSETPDLAALDSAIELLKGNR